MGLLIGVGSTEPKFPYNNYYGIEWDTLVASPVCTRLGRPELHVSLPIQSRMRRCVLNDAGAVVYYLHAQDSTKRDNGAAADLTGASGQVMVELPEYYIRFEMENTKRRCLISLEALPGFQKVPKMYVSAYEATVDRTVSATLKLASVVNATAAFRGGNNQADWDGTHRSVLGRPATSISLTNYRKYARNRGSVNWNCFTYDVSKTLFWLFAVEYANFNCQANFNPALTSEGYRQGGLGAGVTTLISDTWNTWNAYNPFVPCGHTNSLGNSTGNVPYSLPAEYSATILTVQVPSYRGVENPFGHVWHHTDGVKVRIQSDASDGLSELYVCNDPNKYQDSNYNDYELRGVLPRKEGYIKEVILGEFGEIMPKEVGGSSTTYFSDYFYTAIPASGESQRAVLFGAAALYGAAAGFGCSDMRYTASLTYAYIGSRLCFYQGV